MISTEAEPTDNNDDHNNNREFIIAVCRNNVRTVFRLLNRSNIHTICVEALGSTPIHCAAIYGEADLVRHIIRLDPSTVTFKDLKGETPLHIAARGGHMDVVRVLLEASETDHNSLNNENRYPSSMVPPELRDQYRAIIDELRPSTDPLKEGLARLFQFLGIYKTEEDAETTRSDSNAEPTQNSLRLKTD